MKKLFVLACMVLLGNTLLYCQDTLILEGKVIDERTEKAIAGAKVAVFFHHGTIIETFTDESGVFKIPINRTSQHRIEVAMPRYLKVFEKVDVLPDDIKKHSVTIRMKKPAGHPKLGNFLFGKNSAHITVQMEEQLGSLLYLMGDNPGLVIGITIHRDCSEFSEIVEDRLQVILKFLVEMGIEEDRFKIQVQQCEKPFWVTKKVSDEYAFLEEGAYLTEEYIEQLTDDNQKEIARSYNRRVEFRVLQNIED